MPQIKSEVKTYLVTYKCDQCNKGDMIATGVCLEYPLKIFPHVCNACGFQHNFREEAYPRTEIG